MNKLNSTITMQINVGYGKHRSAAYNIFAAGSYTDTLLGENGDMESRKLEMPCNEPWMLVYAEDCNGTSKLSVVGFDGKDVKQFFFDEANLWCDFLEGLCEGTFEDSNYFPPVYNDELLGLFDAILNDTVDEFLATLDDEDDDDGCEHKCSEAQGLPS